MKHEDRHIAAPAGATSAAARSLVDDPSKWQQQRWHANTGLGTISAPQQAKYSPPESDSGIW